MKDNDCALCGAKLIQRGKIQKEFSTKNFGTDKKQVIRPVCKECQARFST